MEQQCATFSKQHLSFEFRVFPSPTLVASQQLEKLFTHSWEREKTHIHAISELLEVSFSVSQILRARIPEWFCI